MDSPEQENKMRNAIEYSGSGSQQAAQRTEPPAAGQKESQVEIRERQEQKSFTV